MGRPKCEQVCSKAVAPKLFGTRDCFTEDSFFTGVEGVWRMVLGWFKHIMFIEHFISIVITSAPPQIIRH